MWENWVASLKKYSNKTDYLYFILCIAGIVLLAWTLKNCIKAGDEVIAGISAALITLLGVKLTNKNSQIALDKQLKHQSENFQTQMKDQADGFKEQMAHQSELLERQMKHQSDENDKDRKQKFKHDQYVNLIKNLNNVQVYFSTTIFLKYEEYDAVYKLAFLKENSNICKITSSIEIANQLDELHSKYYQFLLQFMSEVTEFLHLRAEQEKNKNILKLADNEAESLAEKHFKNENVLNQLKLLTKDREELINLINEINSKVALEQTRLMKLFKDQLGEINLNTAVIVRLINIELGYTSLEDFINL